MKTMAYVSKVPVVALLALVACANADDSSTEDIDAAHATLTGTYKAVGTDGLGLGYSELTFKSSGSFVAKTASGSFSGTWKISKGGTMYRITLNEMGGGSRAFNESWDGFQLMLFNDTTGDVTSNFYNASWTKHIPIGDVCEDNAGKSLGECADDGNFACGPDGTNANLNDCVPLD